MLKAVFFDLDGTLLPMNEDEFTKLYFKLISEFVEQYGYEQQKLINTIWEGTKKMYKNDGSKTNEKVFWEYFASIYGNEKVKDKKYFDSFYENQFKEVKKTCGINQMAKEIIRYVNENIGICILTTNPIFPLNGVKTRLSFLGLSENDFKYITTYENSYYCKPNPKYFESVLERFSLKRDEVIVFGNNDIEDYLCATKAGIKCYLVGDNLMLHDDLKIDAPRIEFNEIIEIINEYKEKENEKS